MKGMPGWLALLAVLGCGGQDGVAPTGFGIVAMTVGPTCSGGERAYLWIDDVGVSGSEATSVPVEPQLVEFPNIGAGPHGWHMFRQRYYDGVNNDLYEPSGQLRVATGARTVLRLDCPGVTVINPPAA